MFRNLTLRLKDAIEICRQNHSTTLIDDRKDLQRLHVRLENPDFPDHGARVIVEQQYRSRQLSLPVGSGRLLLQGRKIVGVAVLNDQRDAGQINAQSGRTGPDEDE